jgi:4-hydroxy-2-oxoheptanedioate aldolase
MRENNLLKMWRNQQPIINGWVATSNSFNAEVMAHQGWDSITVDMQHGLVDYQAMVQILQAISTTSTVPMVRVPWLDPAHIMKTLDAGAYGIICPMINTVDEAANLVSWTSYAPMGVRSFGPIRAFLYAGQDYPQHANQTILRLAMIETAQALENLDQILQVEGLDGIYIGPSDLSLSLGCTPKLDNLDPLAAQAVDHILARAKAFNKFAGIHNSESPQAIERINKGFNLVTVSSDARMIATGSQAILKEMRNHL